MSELKLNINSLHGIVLREAVNDSIQEADPELYRSISEFIGQLKREEYDNAEGKIKAVIIDMAARLTSALLRMRLEKSVQSGGRENLLDEEKFILDASEDTEDRRETILASILNGKSRLLESVSNDHKSRLVAVRFLQEMDQIVGADMERYGPFRAEDVATIPYENAQVLVARKIAARIRWEG